MSKKSRNRKKNKNKEVGGVDKAHSQVDQNKSGNIKDAEIIDENIEVFSDFPHSDKQGEKENIFLEGKSIDDIIKEESAGHKTKNYLAVIILLLGALLGSLFVDIAQLVSKEGYSVRALREASIFSLGDKTWVSYDEPVVNLAILSVAGDDLEKCPNCQPPEEVVDLFKKVMPTLIVNEVDVDSEEGKKMIENNGVKLLPALVFSDNLEQTEFYNGEAKVLFSEIDRNDNYLLSLAGLGLPIGKYIETPSIEESNPIIGNKEAPVKIILFSDHQCPYCAKFFNSIVRISKEFGDKVVLIYKDLPLDFHPQAVNSAMAGECANDQGKFWEMSEVLYGTQKQWGDLEDDKVKAFFKKQALSLKMNMEEFDKCLEEGQHKDAIESSKKQAEEFGITGTPGVFIGDEFIGGVIPDEQLKIMIQAKIDEVNGVVENDESDENNDEKDNEESKQDETAKEEVVDQQK